MTVRIILLCIASYLMGSVSFAVLFSKIFTKTDVRDYGSGNAGTTNVLRTAGVLPGVLTFLCDLLKGFFAAYLPIVILKGELDGVNMSRMVLLCGIICMLGHAFPLFFGFKGGKCVATACGVLFAACPVSAVIALSVFIILMFATKIVSVSTLTATVSIILVLTVYYRNDTVSILLSLIMGLIIILRHRLNILRLIKGEEKKLDIVKKKK